ncbi:hypothetical protein [Reyranella sp.]|uniref:hypothetical protein n=1 Tax=Reyranella sp. TaxID=1929291 RepID=UPI003D0BD0B8
MLEAGLGDVRLGCRGLAGFVLGTDHHTVSARQRDRVAHGGGEIERRDTIRRADLDDAAGLGCATELVAEERLSRSRATSLSLT